MYNRFQLAGVALTRGPSAPVLTDFIFKVKTDNAGTSATDQFTIPLVVGNTYNFDVDWGDGSAVQTVTSDAALTHTFLGGAGTYSVSISGTIQGWRFNGGGDRQKVTEITNYGVLSFDADASGAFQDCPNLTIPSTTGPDTSLTTNFFAFHFFNSSLTSVPLMDLSNGETYQSMFWGCSNLTSVPDFVFSDLLVNNNKYRALFRACSSLVAVSNCTFGRADGDVRQMFQSCSSLTDLPFIDFSNSVQFNQMVDGCSSLTTFPAGLDFSGGISFITTFRGCAFGSSAIDNIMAALVASGVTNQGTDISGGTTLPFTSWSAQAQADYNTLTVTRGWTITTN